MASEAYKEELNQYSPFAQNKTTNNDKYTPPDKAKGMIIYPEIKNFVDAMNDTQAGILFKACLSFFVDGEIATIKDKFVEATFKTCCDHIIENNNKYRQTCIQNHKNRKGYSDD